jgi:hypothetical protein
MLLVTAMTLVLSCWIMIPMIPLPHPLQVVTAPLLFLALFVEMISIRLVLVFPMLCIKPSSNQNAFGCSDNADVMFLSCTNNSLQQRVSSSDSSSLIGLHQNPQRNARTKVNSYKVVDDASDAW